MIIAFIILFSLFIVHSQLIQAHTTQSSTNDLTAHEIFENAQNNKVIDSSGNDLTGTLFKNATVSDISGFGSNKTIKVSNFRTITIDGDVSDWNGISSSIEISGNGIDSSGEIRSVYVANNDQFLFIRLDELYPHSSNLYYSNITFENSVGTVFFAQVTYSTFSSTPTNNMYINYGLNFTSDIVYPSGPFLLQSQDDSAGSVQSFNNYFDTIHFELKIPISLFSGNSTLSNHDLQIKFWKLQSESSELGLVNYLINTSVTSSSLASSSTFWSELMIWFVVGFIVCLAIGLSFYYIHAHKTKTVQKKGIIDSFLSHSEKRKNNPLHKYLNCVKCGSSIYPEDLYCQKCGTPIVRD